MWTDDVLTMVEISKERTIDISHGGSIGVHRPCDYEPLLAAVKPDSIEVIPSLKLGKRRMLWFYRAGEHVLTFWTNQVERDALVLRFAKYAKPEAVTA